MASTQLHLRTQGQVHLNLEVQGRMYDKTVLEVMPQACADVILGQKFLSVHEAVVFEFGGKQDPLVVHPTTPKKALCLTAVIVEAPRLFEFVLPNCMPIATPSRSYSREDQTFIKEEVKRLLASGIFEPSRSPWRSQVLVVRNSTKLRFVIDYSQTVN